MGQNPKRHRKAVTCKFCSGDASAPDHLLRCDGKQGLLEALFEQALDPVEGHRRTEKGIAQSRDHSPDDWRDSMCLALHSLARRRQFITSDDLWDDVGTEAMEGANPSALGSVFRSVAKDGAILLTTAKQESQRAPTHRRPLRVWRSLVYEAGEI